MTITKNVHLKENALLFHQFLFFSTYFLKDSMEFSLEKAH